LFARLAYPFCHYIVTPAALGHEDYGPRHLTYAGYQELAYLHPAHFTPRPSALQELGLESDRPLFVLRLVALRGHHDAAASGLPLEATRALVRRLADRGRLLITAEGELLPEFERHRFALPAERLHDVLAAASLYVGDSQTMAMEAAVLGIPGIRCNSFVGRISVLEELEHRYGLTRGFLPARADDLLRTVDEWLAAGPRLREEWRGRRDRMIEESVDLSEWQWQTLLERARRDD
jgi:predicted glycosyltransferase